MELSFAGRGCQFKSSSWEIDIEGLVVAVEVGVGEDGAADETLPA